MGVITRGSPTGRAHLGWWCLRTYWLFLGPTLGILTYLSLSKGEREPIVLCSQIDMQGRAFLKMSVIAAGFF